jgi:hypothetical protein
MFDAVTDHLETDRVTRYRIYRNGAPLTYATALDLWQSDPEFRQFYSALLADSPFPAYRWETPAISESAVDRPFEFVLINSPGFGSREAEAHTFADYYTDSNTDAGIVSFANLYGDARLIVPSPRATSSAYGHLAAFVRNAPPAQVDSIWRITGAQVCSHLGSNPVWLSTAGDGVAWLHIRIDSQPKYYGHAPYKIE